MDKFFIILLVIALVKCENNANKLKFSDDFLFGAASAAYQIEGAWNVSDKSKSNWDHYVHEHPEKITDHSTADVTCDSYHKYQEDFDILDNLKVNHYRFSLSWPRILPKGDLSYVSKDGLNYYKTLFDELDKRNITPFVTIYHWDHPQILEDYGGWLNSSMPYWFANYTRIVYENFANRTKFFVTVNEPEVFCQMAYVQTLYPPAKKLNGTGDYECVHNMLKAHALAYELYDKFYRSTYHGKIGMVTQCSTPYSTNKNDKKSADTAFDFKCGWIMNPIYSKTGDYPKIMKDQVAERSRAQGLKTRLPSFTRQWIKRIKGSADFLGLNYYTSTLVEPLPKSSIVNWPDDEGLKHTFDPSWPKTPSRWLRVYPEGLGDLLKRIKDKYDNPLIYITENGVTDDDVINDTKRIKYLYDHLKVLHSAINDGCNVKGYTVWSLMDNYEWRNGYTHKFGLVQVDFNDVNRTRTLRQSALWYKTFLQTRQLAPI